MSGRTKKPRFVPVPWDCCPICGNDIECLTNEPVGYYADGDAVRCVDEDCELHKIGTKEKPLDHWLQITGDSDGAWVDYCDERRGE